MVKPLPIQHITIIFSYKGSFFSTAKKLLHSYFVRDFANIIIVPAFYEILKRYSKIHYLGISQQDSNCKLLLREIQQILKQHLCKGLESQ